MTLRFRPTTEPVGDVATGHRAGGETRTIVVGVDGSETSARALRWAVEEASLRGARILAVHAWLYPHVGIGHSEAPFGYEELRQDADELLQATVQAAADTAPGVAIESRLVEGIPADELLAAADGAEMLVLGSRGLGGFVGLLLGSVGQQCARHARCPVVIVPHVEHGSEPAGGGSP